MMQDDFEAALEVRYSCDQCGIADKIVLVRERRHDEDVSAWMEYVGTMLLLDHRLTSEACRAPAAQRVKIPIAGAEYIGQRGRS